MKKIFTQSTSLFLATTMLFASCAGNPDVFDVTNDELETTKDKEVQLSLTIQKLDEINRNLPAPSDVTSRKRKNVDALLDSDIEGAKVGAKVGYRIGKFVGYVFPNVGPFWGGITGGITGGLICGIAGSYAAYLAQSGEEFYFPPEYVMDECASLEEDPEACVEFEEIEVPDSIERIGYIHNLAMDALINKVSAVEILSNEPPFLDNDDQKEVEPVIIFTQFDRDVIASSDYISAYNQIIDPSVSAEPEEGEVVENSILDQVIERYISALKNYASPLDYNTVVSITNQYIAVVNDSAELTDEDRNNLYIAFSVGVYSYKYWSNFDFGATAEEE